MIQRGRLYLPLLLVLLPLALHCQEQRHKGGVLRLMEQVDSTLTARYRNARIDTLYIRRPSTKWTLKVRGNFSGTGIRMEGLHGETPVTGDLSAAYKGTVSFSASYLGITLGGAINPEMLMGKYKDYEFNLNSYGNRFGADLVWQQSKDLKGWMQVGNGSRVPMNQGSAAHQMLYINGYYVFNHQRFSYPAAFSQSYIQRRSQGSALIGFSLHRQRTTHSGGDTGGTLIPAIRMKSLEVGIGAGYAYNYVPSRRWLIHLSALPTIVVYNRHRLWLDGEPGMLQSRFPEVILTSRGAIVYSFGRQFIGTTMVFHFSNLGNAERLEVKYTKWRVRMAYGIRF